MSSLITLRYTDAAKYNRYNRMSKNTWSITMKNYENKIDWRSFTDVLDLGCGPAEFTCNHLPSLLSSDAKITGLDISEEMINYARNHYREEKFKFDVVDVQNREQTGIYENRFDLIISFCCLHWAPNQRSAIENIFTMLKNDGHFVTVFVSNSQVLNIFDIMKKMEQWKPYLSNINLNFPYRHFSSPEKKFKYLLENVGFSVIKCVLMERFDEFDSIDGFFDSINSTYQVIQYLPDDLVDRYKCDFLSVVKANNLMDGRVVIKNIYIDAHVKKVK